MLGPFINWLRTFGGSSIVRKTIVAITGLLLCGFLLSHLTGNLLLLVSADAFNLYAHKLVTNPLIYLAEAGLLAIFLVHLGLAFRLTIENKKARPVNYYNRRKTGRGATFASSTMPYTGIIILIFLILHLLHFKFGTVYETTVDGVVMRDLYKTVFEYFQSHLNTLLYVFCMIATAIHVSHGFHSAFQSLGLNESKFNFIIKKLSIAFALIVGVGFSSLAIVLHIKGAF